jgi:hypothetical protein
LGEVGGILSVTDNSHIPAMTLKRIVSPACLLLVYIPTYALHAGVDNYVDFATPVIYALGPSEHLVNNQPEPVLAPLPIGPYSLLYRCLLVLVVLAPPLPLLADRSDRLDLRKFVIDGVLQAADLLAQQVLEGRLQLLLQGV